MVAESKKSASASKYKQRGRFFPFILILIVVMVIAMFCWMWRGQWGMATCTTENLKLTAGQQSGAAGTIYQHMTLTNTGKKTCTMSGYPTAFLYGSNGYPIGNSAAARQQPAPTVIALAPGETANTVLGYPQAGNFNPGVCSATKSTMLELYPPSSTTPLEVPLEVNWCPGFSESSMQSGN